jgi:signal transduction histidine kinase
MIVQAGASEAMLEHSPQDARESLREVQSTGQQAISELTRMLGLLRQRSGETPYRLDPQPGADQLAGLMERLNASGLRVRLAWTGEARTLPPGVDLTVFRIVQEALTNTLKHAGPETEARVEVRYQPTAVEIEVTDDGAGPPATSRQGRGHGLIGMAERVSIFEGCFEAGARPEGGFRVFAELPTEPT